MARLTPTLSPRYPGQDALGPFEGTLLTWNGGAYETEFRAYNVLQAVVFEARYPSGLVACANGSNTDVVTAFPTLGPASTAIDTSLNYMVRVSHVCAYVHVATAPARASGSLQCARTRPQHTHADVQGHVR